MASKGIIRPPRKFSAPWRTVDSITSDMKLSGKRQARRSRQWDSGYIRLSFNDCGVYFTKRETVPGEDQCTSAPRLRLILQCPGFMSIDRGGRGSEFSYPILGVWGTYCRQRWWYIARNAWRVGGVEMSYEKLVNNTGNQTCRVLFKKYLCARMGARQKLTGLLSKY